MAVPHRAPADATGRPPGPAIGSSLWTQYGWQIELDLRSLKSAMQMRELRRKTPAMVEKEVWAHLLAYNLLRTVMAVAASENDVEPRAISFKGAKQTLMAFAPKLEAAQPQQRAGLVDAP